MPETVVHFQIRINPSVYEQLSSWAKEGKESLNALVVRTLREAVEEREAKLGKSSDLLKSAKS